MGTWKGYRRGTAVGDWKKDSVFNRDTGHGRLSFGTVTLYPLEMYRRILFLSD